MPLYASANAGSQISVSVAVFPPEGGSGALSGVMIVDPEPHSFWPDRAKRLDGTAKEVDKILATAGFDKFEGTRGETRKILGARNAPPYALYGRRDIEDATWTDALDAIREAALTLDPPEPFRFLIVPTRDESAQRIIAKWASDNGILFVFVTPSEEVRDNALGSLEKLIKADGSQCVMICYDCETESNASAPSVTSSVGPWNIPPGVALSAREDSETPEESAFDAARGRRVGTNTGPFNLEPGWHFDFKIDQSATVYSLEIEATAATLTAAAAGPYVLADNMAVELIFNGVSVPFVLDTTDFISIGAATATELEAVTETAIGVNGTADDAGAVFSVSTARRGNGASLILGPGTDAAFAAALGWTINQTALGEGNVSNVDATTVTELRAIATSETGNNEIGLDSANHFGISGLVYGTNGKAEALVSSTANFLLALGITSGVSAGSGDAADSRKVTAAEAFALLSADLSGPAVSVDLAAQTVTITGDNGLGLERTLSIVGGLATALGIEGEFSGNGAEDDWADGAWVGARAGLDLSSPPPNAGHLPWGDVAPGVGVVYGSRSLRGSVVQRLIEVQNVNVLTVVRPSRGAAFQDGRLLLPYENGQPAFIDQWVSAQWLAGLVAMTCYDGFARVSDGGNKISYFSSDAYEGFLRGLIESAGTMALQSGCIGQIVMEPNNYKNDKPTGLPGVTIWKKSKLAPTVKGNRKARASVTWELAGALQGVLVDINLFAN